MLYYFTKRLLLMIPTFVGITLLVFFVTRMVPGGPVEQILMETVMATGEGSSQTAAQNRTLSQEQLDELNRYYGFDKPVLESYFIWLGKVLTLDLGMSTRYNFPVWDLIKERFPISIYYGLATLILTYAVCIPLGIRKAIQHGSRFDNISSGIVFIGYALPGYVVGVAMLTLFASELEWFPLGGFISDEFEDFSFVQKVVDIVYHSILPLTALSLIHI